jgi:arylsulfatase A-like enzyme
MPVLDHTGKAVRYLSVRAGHAPPDWRQYAIIETDYSHRGIHNLLNLAAYDCRAVMIRNKRWKYIHYNLLQPQLFDLENDPTELNDLGDDSAHHEICKQMQQLLIDWRRRLKPRLGMPYDNLANLGPECDENAGIIIGRW